MSDIPARQNPGPHVELTDHPNPEHETLNPERIQLDPTLQPDHPVSGFTLAVAAAGAVLILVTVLYGLNNTELASPTVASTGGDATASADQNAPAQNQETPATPPAASSAPVPSGDTKAAASKPSQPPASGQAPASQTAPPK